MTRYLAAILSMILPLGNGLGCASNAATDTPAGNSAAVDVRRKLSELDIVDCIVEGRVLQMGRGMTYLESPRMARISEFECASMGGTFVAYDPTSPEEVIERWLPFAEAGDVAAQHRIGLLYEGVMGIKPDYEKAAYWYERAVKKGHRESMYALSILYEKGLGVEKDIIRSLNLYREASGLGKDSIMLSSEAYRQIDAIKEESTKEIDSLKAQIDALRDQIKGLLSDSKENKEKIDALTNLVAKLEGEVSIKQTMIASLPTYRLIDRQADGTATRFEFPRISARVLKNQQIGRFYALIIANNNYDRLPGLLTPHNDARSIAEILSTRYGFSTQILLDANEEQIKRAIDEANRLVGKEDNLLIYFAGHGHSAKGRERSRLLGYWLPTNADADQDVNWVDNWWVTDHLEAGKARRALIIADSCYGGLFSTDLPIGPVAELPALEEDDLRDKLRRKSRFVLASGGDAPVLDATNSAARHSVFAGALIDVLEANSGVLSVVELYGRVFDRMYDQLAAIGLNQEPELRVIRAAGHQGEGDFFFVGN